MTHKFAKNRNHTREMCAKQTKYKINREKKGNQLTSVMMRRVKLVSTQNHEK